MQPKDHISELFKDTFSNYEVPVRPELWQNVASKIQSPAAGESSVPDGSGTTNLVTASAKLSGSLLTWVSVATVAVTIATGVYFYVNRDSKITLQTDVIPESGVSTTPEVPQKAEDPTITSVPTSETNSQPSINETSLADPGRKIGDLKSTGIQNSSGIQTEPVSQISPIAKVVSPKNVSSEEINPVQSATNSGIGDRPVNVESPAKPKVQALPATGYAPLKVEFSASVGEENNEWNFGDGSETIKGSSATHTFTKPGTYLVTLKNMDGTGKIHTELINIEVLSDLTISGVPNIFTPNGDGSNDVFAINTDQDIDIEVSIFDHNGRFVHRFKGIENSWNGKINNIQDAGEGTYFYVIFATGKNGEKNTQKGTVTIKR